MASYGLQLGRSNTWWRDNEVYFPKDPTSHVNHIRLARNSQFPPDCFFPQELQHLILAPILSACLVNKGLMQPCSGHCFSSIFSESRAPPGPPLVTHSIHKAPTATTLYGFCLDQVSLCYLPVNARAGSGARLLIFGTPHHWRLSLKPSFLVLASSSITCRTGAQVACCRAKRSRQPLEVVYQLPRHNIPGSL
jgi:hypothetical protein